MANCYAISQKKYKDARWNYDIGEPFTRLDISDKNKGAKIPLQQRKNMLSLAISIFQDMDDFPMKLSTFFSGNDSKVYNLFFDDVTREYTDKTIAGDLIDSHIKKVSESKRKALFLGFDQKSLLSEFHTYCFNVKLGMKATYSSSTSSTTDSKSLALIKLW